MVPSNAKLEFPHVPGIDISTAPTHREIIDPVCYPGKSIEDVAKIVGNAVNTVKTRMFYACKHLATLCVAASQRRWQADAAPRLYERLGR